MFPEALGSERPVVRVKALKPYHSPLICESPLTVAVLGNFCPKCIRMSRKLLKKWEAGREEKKVDTVFP